MKLTIERANLLKTLSHVQSVVERRTTIPILSNVLLRAEPGVLRLTATDMDMEIVESVAADVAVPGAATAPAHVLYEIARKLPDGAQVEIDGTGDGQALQLSAGRSRFRLGSLPVEDFPSMSEGDMPTRFSLAPGDLRLLIDRTRFAISTEETRYYLNGIFFHATTTEDKMPVLRAVATDGHRLARIQMTLPSGAETMPDVIVPRKTVTELRKLLDEATDSVTISLSASKIRVATDGIMLTSKLIDGTFPDYERVIPSNNDKTMEVEAKSLAEAVDRVATIATEKSRAVKLSVSAGEPGTLTLMASNTEQGLATEELEVSYSASDLEIGFNARYLLDITQQIDGDAAQFSMFDAASPTVVRDMSDSSALYVLMPMRV
ncbi:MAG: DNA polymerase III subunit beta [Rhodospirillaceae bacterium]|nr:DNA polymerase III subunit beta [Rhodospirillaceae bacterium]